MPAPPAPPCTRPAASLENQLRGCLDESWLRAPWVPDLAGAQGLPRGKSRGRGVGAVRGVLSRPWGWRCSPVEEKVDAGTCPRRLSLCKYLI